MDEVPFDEIEFLEEHVHGVGVEIEMLGCLFQGHECDLVFPLGGVCDPIGEVLMMVVQLNGEMMSIDIGDDEWCIVE